MNDKTASMTQEQQTICLGRIAKLAIEGMIQLTDERLITKAVFFNCLIRIRHETYEAETQARDAEEGGAHL